MPTQRDLKQTMFACAEDAVKVLLRHFGKLDSIGKKGEIDLVTVADKEAEEAIIRRLTERGARLVVTTHHSALKILSQHESHIENASLVSRISRPTTTAPTTALPSSRV